MIFMKPNIAWKIILNNTGLEWHVLQNALEKPIQDKIFLHTVSKNELTKEFSLVIGSREIDFYFMWDAKETQLLIGCLLIAHEYND